MTRRIAFAMALCLALLAPLLPGSSLPQAPGAEFPGWPAKIDGVTLRPLPPGPQDEYFARDFPGKVARFAAGGKQVVVRWVSSPTRRLHPAAHCFTGAGYQIRPLPMGEIGAGRASCFSASRAGEVLRVCEMLSDGAGASWPDVSSWYWQAVAAPAGASWWSYVIVEHEDAGAL